MRKLILLGLIGLLALPTSLSAGNATASRIANRTFAGLPKSPVVGEIFNATDATVCTIGVALTAGGGSMLCQVTYNGNGWLPAGGASGTATGTLISAVLGCVTPNDIVAGHDDDTPICAVYYGASGSSNLPPGNYVVEMSGNVGVTIGPVAPATLGFDLIDASGHTPLWILTTSWEPDVLLVPNTSFGVAVAASSNFTVAPGTSPALPAPSIQAFPVTQDVTILKDSSIQFQIFQRTTFPGYDRIQ